MDNYISFRLIAGLIGLKGIAIEICRIDYQDRIPRFPFHLFALQINNPTAYLTFCFVGLVIEFNKDKTIIVNLAFTKN